jgi:UDP:flavonoid glycosyltransferase YjiC (YdhE family)
MAEAWRPDVVVHELYELAGWEAAAVSGAVDIVHGFGTHLPDLPDFARLVGSVIAEGLGTPNRAADSFSAPYIDPCPPSLQPPEVDLFRDVVGIRPEVGVVGDGERLPEAMRRLPYKRTIYLTLGTVFNDPDAWWHALEAVRDLEVNVLATTGTDIDPAVFGPQPGHVAMAQFVPQALVLKHVDAVVCHAGSGTMLGALAEGRPIVALPMAADQFANAEQIVRTGAGLTVGPEERTPDTIRSAINEVLGGLSFAQAAYALQAEIAAMPSAEQQLAELVERVAVAA